MNVFNIALWTIGDHSTRNILPAIEKNKSLNLVGIYTRNRVTLAEQSQKYKCNGYTTSDDLLEDSKVDLVYICSPNALHYEQAMKCLLNNKHIIVEKTAFMTLREATDIVKLADKKKLIVMEAFMYLFHRQFLELKKLLESKKYGEVISLEAKFGFPHLDVNNIRYSKKLGGGALNDTGAYTISAILNLLGFDSSLVFSSIESDSNYDVDISGLAIFENKSTPVSKKGFCTWAFGASYKNEIKIWCEFGYIIVERAFSKPTEFEARIDVFNNGIKVESYKAMKDNHFINMFDFFVNKLINKEFYKENNKVLAQCGILENIRNKIN